GEPCRRPTSRSGPRPKRSPGSSSFSAATTRSSSPARRFRCTEVRELLARTARAAVVLMALSAGAGGAPGPAVALPPVAVIDPASGRVQPDMTIVVEGRRIASAEPSARSKPPAGARAAGGTGKFLSPGLWDMHVHTFFGDWVPGGREATLPLFVAFGVTGVRDMGSDLDPILAA